MAKEYQGSATGGAFSPNKTLRTGDNSKENENRFASTLADYGQIQASNDRTHIENATKNTQGWNDLAKFSRKLTDKLVKDQQAKNLEDYEAGIADAYMNGIPQGEAEAFDKQEAAINAVGEETDALGAEFAEASGSRSQGEQISASSGWRALGRATGMAKQGAAQYPLFIAMNAERLASASTPQEYAATLAELRREYTGKFGGMNRAMMGKYMFPKMQEFEASQFLSWQAKNNEMIMNDRVDEMSNSFYADVVNGNGGPAFVEFIEKNKHFLNGRGNARKKLFDVIKKGIQNGTITKDQADALKEHKFNFNGKMVSLGEQFAKDFDGLDELIFDDQVDTFNQSQAEIKMKTTEIIQEIRDYQAEIGRNMTEDEKKRIIAGWNKSLGPIPSEINDILTMEDVENQAKVDRLKAKIESNAQITQQDLIGLPAEVQQRYQGFVSPAVTESRKEGKAIVQGYVTATMTDQIGQSDKSPQWHDTNLNAQRKFNQLYSKYLLGGASADQAMNQALSEVKNGLSDGSITDQLDISTNQQTYKNINEGMKFLEKDPSAYQTQVIPGAEEALKQLEQQISSSQATGNAVTVPQYFHTLASGLKGVSGWDLADQQSRLNGGSGLQKPQAEQFIDGLSDETIKGWMTYKPTPARTMRTGVVVEYITGDRSHEGYAADHGGNNYHEHIAFDTPENTQKALKLLESNNIYVGSRNDGDHATDSYHYSDQAFDVPLYPNLQRLGLPDNKQGEEQFSAMVRDLLSKNGFGGAGIRASRTQPVNSTQKQFLDLVASKESGGDYEAFNIGGSHTNVIGSGYGNDAAAKFGKSLSQMSLSELMQLGSSGRIFAAGRYQITPQTLRGLVRTYNLDPNDLYDEEMQDQLALKLAYQRLVSQNKMTGLRNEWIALNKFSDSAIKRSLGQAYNNPELLLKGV